MNSYPDAGALLALIGGVAQAPDPGFLDAAVQAGIEGFERETGRRMLAGKNPDNTDRAAEPRRFSRDALTRLPTGYGLLDFGAYGDIVRVDSVVLESFNENDTLTEDVDYRLEPMNAPSLRLPWDRMEMRRVVTGFSGPWFSGGWSDISHPRIAVTGLWGYSTALPADAWQAMLYAGAMTIYEGSWMQARAKILTGVADGSTASLPLKSWTGPGSEGETYATEITTEMIKSALGNAGAANGWAGTIAGAIQRYRRLDI